MLHRIYILIICFMGLFSSAICLTHQCAIVKNVKSWCDQNYANCTIFHYKNVFPFKLNVSVDVKQNLETLLLHLEVNYKTKQQNFPFVNTTMDLCKLLAGKDMNPIIRAIIAPAMGFSTFIQSCPVKPGYYYIEDYSAGESVLPPVIPKGNLNVKFIYSTLVRKTYKRFAILSASVDVDPKRNKIGC